MVNQPPVDYPYARGDLLEQRQNYFYSAFRGAPFLDAWRASRRAALDLLDRPEEAVPCSAEADAPQGPTLLRLHALRDALAGGAARPADWAVLDRLLQRFEVSKRVHAAYDAAFKPIDVLAYRDLRLYVAFAEVLIHAATHSTRLSYLNALLKCMDTLAAAAADIPRSHRARARTLFGLEDDLVAHVQRAAGGMSRC